jgi:hypothetical protein
MQLSPLFFLKELKMLIKTRKYVINMDNILSLEWDKNWLYFNIDYYNRYAIKLASEAFCKDAVEFIIQTNNVKSADGGIKSISLEEAEV